MTIRFDGQVAIITGAGRGMGRSAALLLANRGAKVVVNDYGGDESTMHAGTINTAESVVEEILAAGGEAVADGSSVGTSEAAQTILDRALDAFGRVDILINNAGGGPVGLFDSYTDDEVETAVRSNYIGPYMLMRRVWPLMREQRYGRIVNVSSSAVLGMANIAPYSSSKAALVGLTAGAAAEGAEYNIKVNAIWPVSYSRLAELGQADMVKWLKTYFLPERVAQVTAYLVSREVEPSGEIFSAGGNRIARNAFINAEGFYHPDLSPELIAENIAEVRDMSHAELVTSTTEENRRYYKTSPWTGGAEGTFGS